jgi:uncharacterized damage-inducible protein DinB
MHQTRHNQDESQAILRLLQDSHTVLASLIRQIPEERLHTKRRAGSWSLAEHAAHLAEVQPMLADRIARILREDEPEFVPFNPNDADEAQPRTLPGMDEILGNFKAGRDRIVALLAAAADEDWARGAVHPEYEQYGLFILARHILMHDHWHMYRMEELWLARDAYITTLEG